MIQISRKYSETREDYDLKMYLEIENARPNYTKFITSNINTIADLYNKFKQHKDICDARDLADDLLKTYNHENIIALFDTIVENYQQTYSDIMSIISYLLFVHDENELTKFIDTINSMYKEGNDYKKDINKEEQSEE